MNSPNSLECSHLHEHYILDLSTRALTACCRTQRDGIGHSLATDLERILKLRGDLKAGERPAACQTCWKLEAQQLPSHRIPVARRFTEHPFELPPHHPDTLELLIGSACNLKCVYCGPQASTVWESALKRTQAEAPIHRPSAASPELDRSLKVWIESIWSGLAQIKLIGGEPLVTPHFLKRIEDLIELERRFCASGRRSEYIKRRLVIISNLAISTSKLQPLLSRLSELVSQTDAEMDVEFGVSFEAIGERFEYIRDGADFATFDANLELLCKTGFQIRAYPSINLLALRGLADFYDYLVTKMQIHSRPIFLDYNEISDPAPLSPGFLGFAHTEERARVQAVFAKIANSDRASEHLKINWSRHGKRLASAWSRSATGTEAQFETFMDDLDRLRIGKRPWRTVFTELSSRT